MEHLSDEERLIQGFCYQSTWDGAEADCSSVGDALDETGCGLSADDVFSLGLLDLPRPAGEGGQEEATFSALTDPQLACSGSLTLDHEQCSSTMQYAPEGQITAASFATMSLRQMSCLSEQLRHFQYPPLISEMCSPLPFYSGTASVFVPVSYSQPCKALDVAEGAPKLRKLNLESLTSAGSLDGAHSTGSLGSNSSCGAEACVPDMSPRSCGHHPKAEACIVPICFSHGMDGYKAAPERLSGARQLGSRSGGGQALAAAIKAEEGSGCGANAGSDADTARVPVRPCDASADTHPLSSGEGGSAAGHTRTECLRRYRDKKLRRHFAHKVRYTARKLNADRRPRVKGRFVKAGDMPVLDLE